MSSLHLDLYSGWDANLYGYEVGLGAGSGAGAGIRGTATLGGVKKPTTGIRGTASIGAGAGGSRSSSGSGRASSGAGAGIKATATLKKSSGGGGSSGGNGNGGGGGGEFLETPPFEEIPPAGGEFLPGLGGAGGLDLNALAQNPIIWILGGGLVLLLLLGRR